MDISHNKLRDLSPIKSLAQLITLKAHDNILVDVQLVPLEFLQKVDLSNNFVNTAEGLNHPFLSHLNINSKFYINCNCLLKCSVLK